MTLRPFFLPLLASALGTIIGGAHALEPVVVHVGKRAIEVRTIVHGGTLLQERRIVNKGSHLEIIDRVFNSGKEIAGIKIEYTASAENGEVYLGGRFHKATSQSANPWNPTVFIPVDKGGVGLVAEDDVLRQQLRIGFNHKKKTAFLKTNMLCLAPGKTHDMVWSVYPFEHGDYWRFINLLRVDWGVNHQIPGSYAWFTPAQILAMPETVLKKALEKQGTMIASMWGGWVDHGRTEKPPIIGFGTYVLSDIFAELRKQIKAAIQKLRAAKPGLRVLIYFDSQRESDPNTEGRFKDSWLAREGGEAEFTLWGGKFSKTWLMVPTQNNTYGKSLGGVIDSMKELGANGLYWDEMDTLDYGEPRFTSREWDQFSCILDNDGGVRRKVGLVNLISDPVKLDYANKTGFVLGNSPPTTRAFQNRKDIRMIEAQHISKWGSFAHLTTPLGYIGSNTHWSFILDKLREGLLIASTRLDYPFDILARMFPFTPEDIGPGVLKGSERIITTHSGIFGWSGGEYEIAAFRYDSSGKESPARWKVTRSKDGTYVDVQLGHQEAAVIEKLTPTVNGKKGKP